MSKYYSINEFLKILRVSAQTLRNWDKNGKLHPLLVVNHKVNVLIKLEN